MAACDSLGCRRAGEAGLGLSVLFLCRFSVVIFFSVVCLFVCLCGGAGHRRVYYFLFSLSVLVLVLRRRRERDHADFIFRSFFGRRGAVCP